MQLSPILHLHIAVMQALITATLAPCSQPPARGGWLGCTPTYKLKLFDALFGQNGNSALHEPPLPVQKGAETRGEQLAQDVGIPVPPAPLGPPVQATALLHEPNFKKKMPRAKFYPANTMHVSLFNEAAAVPELKHDSRDLTPAANYLHDAPPSTQLDEKSSRPSVPDAPSENKEKPDDLELDDQRMADAPPDSTPPYPDRDSSNGATLISIDKVRAMLAVTKADVEAEFDRKTAMAEAAAEEKAEQMLSQVCERYETVVEALQKDKAYLTSQLEAARNAPHGALCPACAACISSDPSFQNSSLQPSPINPMLSASSGIVLPP